MKRIVVLTAVAALALALTSVALAGGTRTVTADPHGALKFNTKRITVTRGTVTLAMRNPSGSGIAHGIAVEGHGVDKDGKTVSPGHTSRVTVKLKPGKYEFYCPVPGHKAAGMKGTLIVK